MNYFNIQNINIYIFLNLVFSAQLRFYLYFDVILVVIIVLTFIFLNFESILVKEGYTRAYCVFYHLNKGKMVIKFREKPYVFHSLCTCVSQLLYCSLRFFFSSFTQFFVLFSVCLASFFFIYHNQCPTLTTCQPIFIFSFGYQYSVLCHVIAGLNPIIFC